MSTSLGFYVSLSLDCNQGKLTPLYFKFSLHSISCYFYLVLKPICRIRCWGFSFSVHEFCVLFIAESSVVVLVNFSPYLIK